MRDMRFLVVAAVVASWGWPAAGADAGTPARLLVVSVTAGFRHTSIGTAEPVLEELGRATGHFHCDFLRMPPGRLPQPKAPKRAQDISDEEWTQQEADFKAQLEAFHQADRVWQAELAEQFARVFSAESLRDFDGVIFLSTTGELPVPEMTAFLDWIKSGKAFIGFHAATDTFKSSDAYCEMIGGHFAGHPWNAGGEHAFVVHEPEHRVAAMFPERFRWQDEIYQYDLRYQPGNLRVLVSLDMQASSPKEPWHVPVSWVRDYGKGRVFATNFGHNDATWKSPMFQKHMAEGIAWALGRFDAPAAPNPAVQAAEYVRSVVAAAAAATQSDADTLLAKANARIAKDAAWAESLRPMLLDIRSLKPDDRAAASGRVIAEVEKP
ncbi:MAG: ThuA domain-containing protein [Planctomycetota bacterium]